jgi:hypothetical protein
MRGMFYAGVIAVVLLGTAQAEDDEFSRSTLAGLRGVCLIVQDLPAAAQEVRLTEDAIRTDAELKLRLAGIRLLTQDEARREPGAPALFLVNNVVGSNAFYGYGLTNDLRQAASLVRDPRIETMVSTWSVRMSGCCAARGMVTSHVREAFKDMLDHFIKAYLSVNPKS